MAELHSNGIRIAYSIQGDGDPVVLVAGTAMPAALWGIGMVPRFLDAGFQVVTFENRGMPPTDAPEGPYSVAQMGDDTIGLIEGLGLSRVRLMGLSLGGLITQDVARRRPDLVRAAVFWAGVGNFSLFGRELMRGYVHQLRLGEMADELVRADTLRDFLPPSDLQLDEVVRPLLELLIQQMQPWGNPGRLGQYEADLTWSEVDHQEELRAIAVPCLAVAHEHDVYFPPRLVEVAAKTIPHCEYVRIANANHNAFAQAEEISARIVEFWRDA
jgi:pimeloyl-ACP methyl ester carboxylesterase